MIAVEQLKNEVLASRVREEILAVIQPRSSDDTLNQSIKTLQSTLEALTKEAKIQNKKKGRKYSPPGELPSESALNCLHDNFRTKKFLMALYQVATSELIKIDCPVVIDAGCGPIPILGLAVALFHNSAQVTCLESNPQSAIYASEIIQTLGLESRIKVIRCDAKSYTHNQNIDLLISETLDKGLINEECIQIMDHLRKQLKSNGICIPNNIQLFSTFENIDTKFNTVPMRVFYWDQNDSPENTPPVIIPICTLPGWDFLKIQTTIQLCPGITLWPNESIITLSCNIPREKLSGPILRYLPGQLKIN